MTVYELNNFKNGKAFFHTEESIDNSVIIGNGICINSDGVKLFELPHPDMFCNQFEDEDVAFVYYKNKYALVNSKGEFLTDFIYDSIFSGSEEGLFEVERDNKHGHIDIYGKEVIPCMYDEGSYFSEGVCAECLNNKWGMIDYFNNIVIPFEYEYLSICKSNIISACKNGKYGLINKSNKVLVDFIYDDIDCWGTRECLAVPAKLEDKYGLIDRYGNIVQEFIYDNIQILSDEDNNFGEFLCIKKDTKKALYTTKYKKFLTDFVYSEINYVSENRFCVEADNKFGYIDTHGTPIIPIIYDFVSEYFKEGLAVVKQNNKSGMINLDGEIVIPLEYKKLQECSEGLILATTFENKTGFIDKNNNQIIPLGKFNYINSRFHEGYAVVNDDKLGEVYINKEGEVLKIKV